MKNPRLENIEIAILDLALRIEAGGRWYDKQHPDGIYQHIAGVLFGGEKIKK